MQKSLTSLLLLLLLLPSGCRESEITISEDPEEEIFLVDEQSPNGIDISGLPDPNNRYFYVPDNIRPPYDLHSLYPDEIIKPDKSFDYKIIIIPPDPNCDPGIFLRRRPQTKPRQNLPKK